MTAAAHFFDRLSRLSKKQAFLRLRKGRSLRKKPIRGVFRFQSPHFQNFYESYENACLACQKRAPPFFDKLKSLDRAGQGIFQLLQALLAYRYLRMPSVATEASAVRVTVNFTVLASLNLSSQHRNFSTAVKSSLCTILQRLST